MSVLARTLSAQSKKPGKWPASYGRVAPEWRWFWRDLVLGVPYWNGSIAQFAVGDESQLATVSGTPTVSSGRFGRQVAYDGSDYLQFDIAQRGTTQPFTWFTVSRTDGNLTDRQRAIRLLLTGTGTASWVDFHGGLSGDPLDIGTATAGGVFPSFQSSESYQVGEWYALAGRWPVDGNQMEGYFDHLGGTFREWGNVQVADHRAYDAVALGSNSGSLSLAGPQTVFYLWDRTLTRQQVESLARDPFGPFRMGRQTMVVVPAVPETLQRSTRLEASRTNNLTQSEDFSHADWTKSNVTVTADAATAPDGATTADNLSDTASGAHGFVSQAHTVADDSLDDAASVHFEKKLSAHIAMIGLEYSGGTGLVYEAEIDLLTGETDTANSPDAPTRVVVEDWDTFWRVSVVGANNGTGNTTATAKVYPHVGSTLGTRDVSVTGDADVWGAQHEDGAFPSSYFATTTASGTRSADSLSEDISGTPLATPQEMTVYVKFVERGGLYVSPGTTRIVTLGENISEDNPRIVCRAHGSNDRYQFIYATDSGSPTTPLTLPRPSIGDGVELLGVLHQDGHVTLHQSINGGTIGSSNDGTTAPFSASWPEDTLVVGGNPAGSRTTTEDFIALTIESGVHTMDQMRALADAKAGDLYSYYPGDTGLTFSRASVATHRRATRELATADSGELRDFHYVARRVGGEVQITASARVAIQSEVSDSASARVASRAERAETASLRAALRGEASELASLRTALRGEQSEAGSLRAALRGEASEAGSADVAQTGEQSETATLRAALAGAVAEAASLISALAGQLSEDATVRAALREAVAAAASLRVALQSEASDVASLRAALRAEQQADASMRITTVQEGEVTSAASIRASVQGEAAVLSAVRAALLGETAVDVSALIAAVAERQAAASGRIERVDQILRPDADVANPDAWVNELGATTGLWQSLDEVVPDHSDWIEGPP